jgi:uncharacterized damage-inducible protein DinB
MQPRLFEVLEFAERARLALLDLISPLASDQWEARGATGGWRVREVVGHLHLVEDSSVRALFRAFRTARDADLASETKSESVLSSLDWSRLSEVVQPVHAPPFTTPSDEPTAAVLLTRLEHSRAGLRKWAAEADGFALAAVTFPHPALGKLNLYQWVLMIGQHERRHITQIERILASHQTVQRFTNSAAGAKAAGAEYTAALLDQLGERDPLAVWAELADAVDRLTANVSPADAVRPEADGKWSIVQVVSHLVDSEIVYAYRIRKIVAEDSPQILGYDQDRWAARLHYHQEALPDLCAELRVLRARNLRFIRRLSSEEQARTGLHNERGPESVWHIVKLLAAHDMVHRNQIARIKRALGL